MQALELADVEAIVRLLAMVGDPHVNRSLADRKRALLEGVAKLIRADIWLWSTVARHDEVEGQVGAVSLIDGGWRDESERVAFIQYSTDPATAIPGHEPITQLSRQGEHFTRHRHELYQPDTWDHLGRTYFATGLHDFLVSVYPVNDQFFSAIGFHVRHGSRPFTDRERAIVHVVFQQVDWLHRDGADLPAGKNVLQLTARQRQVLLFLLGGDTRKEIAQKLNLSEHTIGDYMKSIYRQLRVNSRGELLSLFISGGLSKPGGNEPT